MDVSIPGVDEEAADAGQVIAAQKAFQDCLSFIRGKMDQLSPEGEPAFADVTEYLSATYDSEDKKRELAQKLVSLEKCCCAILRAAPNEVFQDTVPAVPVVPKKKKGPAKAPQLLQCRLYQIGFTEASSVKGASPLNAIVQIMATNLQGRGNQTEKYPIELLYTLNNPGAQVGSPVAPFSVGISVGFELVLASFLCCIAALELPWLQGSRGPGGISAEEKEFQEDIAGRLLRMLRLTGTYQPRDTLQGQVQETLATKIMASQRMRPNSIQMLYGFRRLVQARAVSSRQGHDALLKTAIAEFNNQEQSAFRINPEEVSGIVFISLRTPIFIRRLKIIWGSEKPQHTAMPLQLLGSAWLSPSYPLPFRKEENPAWAAALAPREPLYEEWLIRVGSRFEAKVAIRKVFNLGLAVLEFDCH
jgi:hypothetical protein